MSGQVTIRRYREGDAAPIVALVNSIMGTEFQEAQGAYPTSDLENIPESYGKIGDIFFIAEDGKNVIGTVAIKKEDDRCALLRRLFVSPEYRNRQIGFKLIERAIQYCQEVGYKELIFKTTSQMEGAIKLCQKRGFVQRAQLVLGDVELLKFTLSLKNGAAIPQS